MGDTLSYHLPCLRARYGLRIVRLMSPVNGARIRELRDERGLSQRELARLAGVRQPSLSAIETGSAKRVDVSMLESIASALNVGLTDLLRPAARKRK